jgi:hypothetical protein
MFSDKRHSNEQGANKIAPKIPQHPAFDSPPHAKKRRRHLVTNSS